VNASSAVLDQRKQRREGQPGFSVDRQGDIDFMFDP